VSAIGCHKNASELNVATDRQGQYRFEASLDRGVIRGTMTVTADTILLDPETESCRPALGPSDLTAIKYECIGTSNYDNLVFRLDRHSPATRSSWSATTTVRKQRNVCVEYRVDDKGQRVCSRYETQSYDDTQRVGGALRVHRVTSG
jgi:hypothetical protein